MIDLARLGEGQANSGLADWREIERVAADLFFCGGIEPQMLVRV